MTPAPEGALARFVATVGWADLPPRVQQRVLLVWADAVANALAGRAATTTADLEGLVSGLAGPGDATVLGGGTSSPTGAAFLNAHQVTAHTMCDVHRPLLCHTTPVVLPVVVAVGEQVGATLEQALVAVALGIEVTLRAGLALDDAAYRRRRWHAPGVIGPLGAAAAGARLLGLDVDGIRGALGLAGSQAAGTFVALGTPAVKFHQARGAVSGLWAATMAAGGFGGARSPLSGEDGGMLTSHADGGHPDALLAGLGERWHLEDLALRRWPAASSLQPVVEGVLALRADHDLGPDDVDRLEVVLPPRGFHLCADRPWDEELLAMQSARFVTAAVLHDGACRTGTYTAARRDDPDVGGWARTRVEVSCDDTLPAAGARLVAHGRGRASVEVAIEVPLGDPARPLSPGDVAAKLRDTVGEAATTLWPRLHQPPMDDLLPDLLSDLRHPIPGAGVDHRGA